VKRNNNVLEEDNVLISQWNSESTDDTRQNVEKLGSTVEFVSLMDECKETLIDGLTDHFSSRNKLGVQFVKDILEIVSLDRLLRIKQLEELLHELWSNIHLQRSDFNGFVDYELKKELINAL
jgi:hypothetical protein